MPPSAVNISPKDSLVWKTLPVALGSAPVNASGLPPPLTLDVEETYALLNKAFDLDSLLRLELDILGSINVINTTSFATGKH